MATIQELIDSGEVVLGETKVFDTDWGITIWVIPHWFSGNRWRCQDNFGGVYSVDCDLAMSVYKESVEMEDRWQWAHILEKRTTRFYTTVHEVVDRMNSIDSEVSCDDFIRLDYTKTKFPKEEKS